MKESNKPNIIQPWQFFEFQELKVYIKQIFSATLRAPFTLATSIYGLEILKKGAVLVFQTGFMTFAIISPQQPARTTF